MAIYQLGEHTPEIAPSAYVADGATLIGKVTLEEDVSVCMTVPSCTLLPCPIVMRSLSPRIVTPDHTDTSSSSVTLPIKGGRRGNIG